MKKTYYKLLVTLVPLLLAGCYQDKGNYNYSTLPEVSVSITQPGGGFYVRLGDRLTIPAVVTSQIKESELEFWWEAWSTVTNNYIKFAEGKNLDHTFVSDDIFLYPDKYNVRLVIRHTASGRVKYSDVLPINVTAGDTGLMVMHGNDTEFDIGLVVSQEFLMTSTAVNPYTIPDMYSSANGKKAQGKGIKIVHSYPSMASYLNQFLLAIKEGGGEVMNVSNFQKKGDYSSLFYDGGYGTTNAGRPGGFYIANNQKVVIDGGELFKAASTSQFIIKDTYLNNYDIHPMSFGLNSADNSTALFFDLKTRGFYIISSFYIFSSVSPMTSIGVGETLPFNPNDMQADLVHFDSGAGTGHYMGVFENGAGRFIAHIDFSQSVATKYPRAKYSVNGFTDFGNAKFFTYGLTLNTCYYATPGTVYQYAASTTLTTSKPLAMTDGDLVPITGEITMIKVLKPQISVSYYNRGNVLLVGTYENGQGKLYSLIIDGASGDVVSYKVYTGFDRIIDADIKGA